MVHCELESNVRPTLQKIEMKSCETIAEVDMLGMGCQIYSQFTHVSSCFPTEADLIEE